VSDDAGTGGLDAIRRELIREGLASICEEMAVSVIRTSHSETVKSAMDFSTALCDAKGEIIAQGVTLPNQLGSLPDAVAAILREFGGTFVPGDVVMLNDPFAGGMHLPDVFVVKPVFRGARLIAIVATVAHHADLGGMTPGSMSPYAEECYQEGLRIPPVRLYAAGKPEHGVFALLRASSRVPELVLGDIAAQLVACETGEAGLLRLIEHHGEDVFDAQVKRLLDYTEALTRREIGALPEGTYRFTDYLDDDGVHPGPVAIAVSVTIAGGSVVFDFEGSSAQVRASLNATLSFTKSAAYCAMRTLMRSDIPNNAGFFRPISVRAPLGSIVNCVLPAATGTRGLTGFRVVDAIFGALSPAMPDRIGLGRRADAGHHRRRQTRWRSLLRGRAAVRRVGRPGPARGTGRRPQHRCQRQQHPGRDARGRAARAGRAIRLRRGHRRSRAAPRWHVARTRVHVPR
jgi:N-methylhydantoinase B